MAVPGHGELGREWNTLICDDVVAGRKRPGRILLDVLPNEHVALLQVIQEVRRRESMSNINAIEVERRSLSVSHCTRRNGVRSSLISGFP